MNRSTRVKELQALGNLCAITPDARSVPVPSSYLHPMPANSSRHAPPALPPRRSGMYPSGYSRMGMGMGGLGGYYSPYSRYPSFGYSAPYGGYRMGGAYGAPTDNAFIQMAEESTRPAFESIESVVEVVSSISMMLESTYHAVHSSYSAILGVVDQFSRLKDHLAQILSVLALLRGLRWLCLKVLYLLGISKDNPSIEAAWASAEGRTTASPPGGASAWPFLMFVGLVIGAPWLMFKLLSKSVPKKEFDIGQFANERGIVYSATAAYDFNATQPGELSFKAGEKLFFSPKSSQNKGWIYACNGKNKRGLVPFNYLLIKRKSNAAKVDPVPEDASIPDDIPFNVGDPPPSSCGPPVERDDKSPEENPETIP